MPGYEAERLTRALTDGLPSFFKRCKYTAKNRNVQEKREKIYFLPLKFPRKYLIGGILPTLQRCKIFPIPPHRYNDKYTPFGLFNTQM